MARLELCICNLMGPSCRFMSAFNCDLARYWIDQVLLKFVQARNPLDTRVPMLIVIALNGLRIQQFSPVGAGDIHISGSVASCRFYCLNWHWNNHFVLEGTLGRVVIFDAFCHWRITRPEETFSTDISLVVVVRDATASAQNVNLAWSGVLSSMPSSLKLALEWLVHELCDSVSTDTNIELEVCVEIHREKVFENLWCFILGWAKSVCKFQKFHMVISYITGLLRFANSCSSISSSVYSASNRLPQLAVIALFSLFATSPSLPCDTCTCLVEDDVDLIFEVLSARSYFLKMKPLVDDPFEQLPYDIYIEFDYRCGCIEGVDMMNEWILTMKCESCWILSGYDVIDVVVVMYAILVHGILHVYD
ncbi:hypothetical protein Tco_0673757 [Tanacetum coccineum]